MKILNVYGLKFLLLIFIYTFCLKGKAAPNNDKSIYISFDNSISPRENFGVEKLINVLIKHGYKVLLVKKEEVSVHPNTFIIGLLQDEYVRKAMSFFNVAVGKAPGKEGFVVKSAKNGAIIIAGTDFSGVLYGCIEMGEQITSLNKIPENLSITSQPEMVLRGACIGIQKSTYLPGRGVYEYPYTPKSFPWFYNKQLWIKYLDSMVENRMNSLYLWNGHPFASLVKLKDYPYAVEVDDSTFKKNEEIYKFLTTEADKRGIWVIQMFYNIIVSKPFAEHNHMKTQDRDRPIIPIIADYTRKSIAAFVEKYPNVGLLVTLGEAMEGTGQMDVDWFTKTIIPGVKDGMQKLGLKEEPPIVLRAHDTDAPEDMAAALPLYKNLYTMAKYNGEALTTYTPRGSWAELHRKLSAIGTVQIENVHILANLEPFRYGSADFIRKCVLAMHNTYHSNGLHLYPQASYWDWPYTADNADPRLLQMDRDWIWYKEWARYAWNCHRDSTEENSYWSNLLSNKFGGGLQNGKHILEAYEQSGEIAPKLLRRFGITDGNRQTLTLGMLMTQLINPYRYGLFDMLYDSESPEGEKLIEYAEKESKNQPHVGETPVQIIKEVMEHGKKAVDAIDEAAKHISMDKEEFNRLKNDMYCYKALADFYGEKCKAALSILRFKYSKKVSDLEMALPHLEKSVAFYKQLANLTKDTYLYANSMQTQQRKIPMRGVNGTFKTWVEMLPVYENELSIFKLKIDSLNKINPVKENIIVANEVLKNTAVQLAGNNAFYTIGKDTKVYNDTSIAIIDFAKELAGLKGVLLSAANQTAKGTEISFTNNKPIKVLVGFYNSKEKAYLQAPELETNAYANDNGQAEIKIANAMLLTNMPSVNIHTYSFNTGANKLILAKGKCLILGFIDDAEKLQVHDAGLNAKGNKYEIDWLFEN